MEQWDMTESVLRVKKKQDGTVGVKNRKES